MSEERIVSASGIRGVVGSGLDPEWVCRYGAAFGSYLRDAAGSSGPSRVLLGRDTRTSGELFLDAAASGLRAAGWTAVDLGVCPTPTVLLAVEEDPEAAGGIVITASHNPPEWNGLKLVDGTGRFLDSEAGGRVESLFAEGVRYAEWTDLGGRERAGDVGERHLERALELSALHPERIRRQRLTVAVDAAGGAAGRLVPALLRRLGCSVAELHTEPTGRFPREPEPTARHLEGLGERVREAGTDLGMALDPDGDRLSLVDGTGAAVGEDWTLALAVELLAARGLGPAVTNLSTSQVVEDAASRHGVTLRRTPVGEANVAAGMERWDAPIGGEGNGGVMLRELHLTRDALVAAALVLELLAEREAALEELIGEWPSYHLLRATADRPSRPMEEVYEAGEEAAPDGARADRQDGLRLSWPEDGRWVHIRPSGTEPVVRLMAEAPDRQEAEELLAWARLALRG